MKISIEIDCPEHDQKITVLGYPILIKAININYFLLLSTSNLLQRAE